MKKILILIVLLAGAVVAVLFFFFNKKSDEQIIREQLDKLVAECSKTSEEGAISTALKSQRIANYIASNCTVSIRQIMMNGTYSPMKFASILSSSKLTLNSIKGSVYDVEITINDDKKSAIIEYSVRVVGKRKSGESFDESRDLRSEVIKEKDKWKFASFEIREVLEK